MQNKTLWAGLGIAALMLMLIMGAFSSCSAAIQGTGSTFIGTTYPSKDADMKGAEEDYLELEKRSWMSRYGRWSLRIPAMTNTVTSWMRSGMTRIS